MRPNIRAIGTEVPTGVGVGFSGWGEEDRTQSDSGSEEKDAHWEGGVNGSVIEEGGIYRIKERQATKRASTGE